MTLRKGQKLIAWACKKVKARNDIVVSIYTKRGTMYEALNSQDVNATRLIFNMSDKEFDEVLNILDEDI